MCAAVIAVDPAGSARGLGGTHCLPHRRATERGLRAPSIEPKEGLGRGRGLPAVAWAAGLAGHRIGDDAGSKRDNE